MYPMEGVFRNTNIFDRKENLPQVLAMGRGNMFTPTPPKLEKVPTLKRRQQKEEPPSKDACTPRKGKNLLLDLG